MDAGAMVTPDGWRVEVIDLDGAAHFRIKRYRSPVGGTLGPGRGLYRTVEEVAAVMGESFAQLGEV